MVTLPSVKMFAQEEIEEVPSENVVEEEQKEEPKAKDKSRNVNLDVRLFYGQYNSIFSNFSVTQDLENFSYQLKSDYQRSNEEGASFS